MESRNHRGGRPRNTLAAAVRRCIFDPSNHRHRALLREDESLFDVTPDEVGVSEVELEALRDLCWLYRTIDPAQDHPQGDPRHARMLVAEAFQAIVEQGDLAPYLDRFGFPAPARMRPEHGGRFVPCRCAGCIEAALAKRDEVIEQRRRRFIHRRVPVHDLSGRTIGTTVEPAPTFVYNEHVEDGVLARLR